MEDKSKIETKTEYLEVTKTARYSTYGNLSEKTKYLWLTLHGSNMLCEQMLYKFRDFDPEEHFVVSPEALSRFYKNGFNGPVLAAWMTSRDRLEEIKDISNYLTKLWNHYTDQVPSHCKKCILGFSQGGTMAFRWMHRLEVDFDVFLAYSCWVPEDIDLSESKTDYATGKRVYTYGLNDPYLTPDRIAEMKKVIERNHIPLEIKTYDGDHRVDRKQLDYLYSQYIEVK